MSSILEIFFPLCASDTVRWQRRTPDVEHGIWPDVADEQLQQWLQTDAIRLYIPGEWISVWQVELPDVARKQIPTILPALPESERLAVRQQRSKVLLTSLHEWMVEKNGTLSKKSRLGEAFSYVLNQWDALCYYSDDGLAEADNNTAERALRAVCLGKKNYVFFGSDHGGERGALLYGLIGTCRLNGIDPEAYLRHILSILPEWPSNRVDELLPWNVVLTNK